MPTSPAALEQRLDASRLRAALLGAATSADRLTRGLRALGESARGLDTSRLRAAVLGAATSADRLTRGLRALGESARLTAGGQLLATRLGVDVDAAATDPAEWMSPACRGLLCSSCPGLDCHHHCHPEGDLR